MNKQPKRIKPVRAWAVFFTKNTILEQMVAMDNQLYFHPYCIFESPAEAVKWMKEKWLCRPDLNFIKEVEIRPILKKGRR